MHSPIHQFVVNKIFDLNLSSVDISITNSSMSVIVVIIGICFGFALGLRNTSIVPSKAQAAIELLDDFIRDLVLKNIGEKGRNLVPFVMSIFMFVLCANIMGLIPTVFASTSSFVVNFALAIVVFISCLIIGFVKHGFKFFSLFAPSGMPAVLLPLIVLIELFTFLARPVVLALRLTANMVAGHILLEVLAGFAATMWLFAKVLPLGLVAIFTGFEIFVAVLQAYIFAILSCLYLSDAINLH